MPMTEHMQEVLALDKKRREVGQVPHNPEKYVPYRLLWVKVIIRAAYDYALWRESDNLHQRKFALDAEKWLFEPSTLSNGFENICYAFDLDVGGIRKYARALTREEVKKLEFKERQSRVLIAGTEEIDVGGDF